MTDKEEIVTANDENIVQEVSTSGEVAVKDQSKKFISDIIFYGVCVLIILFTIFTSFFWVSTVKVQQNSMYPTLKPNDILILDKLSSYSRGDVIVFSYSENEDYIKRVIAVGGDTVYTINGEVYIEYTDKNGNKVTEKVVEDYVKEQASTYTSENTDIPRTQIPEGKLFVLGDNRRVSVDSRHEKVGLISKEKVKGVVKKFWINSKGVTTAFFGFLDSIVNKGK